MKVQIFAIRDAVVKSFMQPVCIVNEEAALREVGNLVSDPTTVFHKNPTDYFLFRIGQYDDETGIIEVPEVPEVVCNFAQIKREIELQNEVKHH